MRLLLARVSTERPAKLWPRIDDPPGLLSIFRGGGRQFLLAASIVSDSQALGHIEALRGNCPEATSVIGAKIRRLTSPVTG